jgi:hypothetical protein
MSTSSRQFRSKTWHTVRHTLVLAVIACLLLIQEGILRLIGTAAAARAAGQ